MTRSRLIYVFLALTLAILACGNPPASVPDRPALESAVAATLTASSLTQPDKKAAPSLTPSPTPTAEPAGPPASSSLRRIVYTNGDEIWTIEGAGPPTLLTPTADVEQVLISDDGMKVVYVQKPDPEAPVEVHSINFDGSGEMTLLTPAQLNGLYPLEGILHRDLSMLAFVPGTHQLLFNTRAVPEGPGLLKYDDLLSLDADDGEIAPIFAPGSGGDFHIAADGSRMAVVRPESISIATIDGSELSPELVTYSPVITYSEFRYYVKPVWGQDSTMVGVVIPSEDPLAEVTHGTVWRIPADEGPAENAGMVEGEFYFTEISTAPLLSPDLKRLAFRRGTAADNIYDLYIANADGTSASVYTTGKVQWHGWAPDNAHFAFTLDGPMNLHIGELGQPPVEVGTCTQTRWMDSSSFLCLSGSIGNWTLMDGAVDGSLSALDRPAGDFISYDFDMP